MRFSTISFRALFDLVFANLALTVLQVALAYNGLTMLDTHPFLYGTLVGISIAKLVMSNVVRIGPATAPAGNV